MKRIDVKFLELSINRIEPVLFYYLQESGRNVPFVGIHSGFGSSLMDIVDQDLRSLRQVILLLSGRAMVLMPGSGDHPSSWRILD